MGKKVHSYSDIETGHRHKSHHRRSRLPPPPPPPRPWFPWLVPLIFVVDVALFVHSMYLNDCPSYHGEDVCLLSKDLGRFSFEPFRQNPLLGPSARTLKKLGALERDLVVQDHEGWRLLSCIWLHAGLIHLLSNMLSLLFIGIQLEKEFGFLRIGFLYVLAGIAGSLLSCLHSKRNSLPSTISLGASGALFGLLGAMLSELLTNWTIYVNKCAALTSLVIIIALNLAVGFLPHVDNSAHIGGFIAGFFLGFVVLMRPQYGYVNPKHIPPGYDTKIVRKPKHNCCQYVLCLIAAIILIIGYIMSKGLTQKTQHKFYGFRHLRI